MKNINKYRQLEDRQKEIRLEIMNMIIDKESVVSLEYIIKNICDDKNISREYVKLTLDQFIKDNIMVVDDDGNVNYIYPVSAHTTMHKVKLNDGRQLNAMCAIDALGMSTTFNQDIKINSMCCVTGKEIEIDVKDNNIDYINNEDLCVLHINLEKYENWATSCWNIMNFFWTKNEFDVWASENGFSEDENIYCLNKDEAINAAKEIFSTNYNI